MDHRVRIIDSMFCDRFSGIVLTLQQSDIQRAE